MASSPQSRSLTIDEFERQYGDRKPFHEYWFGQAIQKPMPTKAHGFLVKILMMLLDAAGFESIPELRLKLSAEAQPLPDVIATSSGIAGDYPTDPFDIAIEILSPADSMQHLLRKCRMYSAWGIRHIYVFDPEDRTATEWKHADGALQNIKALRFTNRPEIPVSEIWAELDRRLQRLEQISSV